MSRAVDYFDNVLNDNEYIANPTQDEKRHLALITNEMLRYQPNIVQDFMDDLTGKDRSRRSEIASSFGIARDDIEKMSSEDIDEILSKLNWESVFFYDPAQDADDEYAPMDSPVGPSNPPISPPPFRFLSSYTAPPSPVLIPQKPNRITKRSSSSSSSSYSTPSHQGTTHNIPRFVPQHDADFFGDIMDVEPDQYEPDPNWNPMRPGLPELVKKSHKKVGPKLPPAPKMVTRSQQEPTKKRKTKK